MDTQVVHKQKVEKERYKLLKNINELTETPMTILAFVWLGIIILELTTGVSELLEQISFCIWMLFIADFVIELIIAPKRRAYLKENWVNALALVLPALRIFRIFQSFRLMNAGRALRSLNLLKIIASINSGTHALRTSVAQYGLQYVVAFTSIVLFAGSAGMYFFEDFKNYADALWWTTMLMTTIGSEFWPVTIEGRILTVVIAVYSLAIFGYITATLASLLIEKNKQEQSSK